MYGALIGDMIGSRFEFTQLPIRYEFELLNRKCRFTDDTVMSIAVAEALLETEGKDDETVRQTILTPAKDLETAYALACEGRENPTVIAMPYGGSTLPEYIGK